MWVITMNKVKEKVKKILNIFTQWFPHKFQHKVMKATQRFIVITAGRRGGKTNVLARKFWDLIIRDLENYSGNYIKPKNIRELRGHPPKLLYFCVAPTYELSRVQQKELIKTIPREFIIHREFFTGGIKRIWLRGYACIEFKSAERPKTLVGDSVKGLWLDECSKMKEETWDYVGPSLMDNKGSFALFSTTPEGMNNWFYQKIVRSGNWQDFGGELEDFKNHPDYINIYWTSLDNDKADGLREQVLEQQKVLPPSIFDREYKGRYDTYKGQIYSMLSYKEHRVDPHVVNQMIQNGDFKEFLIFRDFGFGHWDVSLLVGLTNDNSLIVIDERFQKNVPILEGNGIKRETAEGNDREWIIKYGVTRYIADAARADLIEHLENSYMMYGVEMIPADKRGGTVDDGIQVVSLLLHYSKEQKPRIQFNKSCKMLWTQMTAYQWDIKQEKPKKIEDDGPDALRYGVYFLFVDEFRRVTQLEIDEESFNLFD